MELIRMPSSVRQETKIVTFDGTAGLGAVGNVALFTVTGEIIVVRISGFCSVDVTEALASATISLGVTSLVAAMIAATAAINIDAGEFWVSTVPATSMTYAANCKDMLVTDSIVAAVATQAVNGGTIRFDVLWLPLSSDGLLVAA